METRIIEFITALRAAGVRVSLAESADALRAIEQAGIAEKPLFRAALQAALIKERHDQPIFQRIFPLYFPGERTLVQAPALPENLSATEQIQQAIQQILANLHPPHLAPLFQAMIGGTQLSPDTMASLVAQVPPLMLNHPYYQSWMTRRVMRELGFEQLDAALQTLLEELHNAGLDAATLEALNAAAQANRQALAEQIGQIVSQQMVERALHERNTNRPSDDLLDRPFERLSYAEIQQLRSEVARLAARLRTQAALRRRHSKRGRLDARATIRASLRFGGVPLIVHHRRQQLKPRLAILCDVSTSMRSVASFMLQLVYALQDQISRTRSFAFIADIEEISADFAATRPAQAVERILTRIRPHYSRTDLGNSLNSFAREHLACVNRRTTVIILGDGRNNFNDPSLETLKLIKSHAHRLIWFNPEPRNLWSSGDSDMLQYEALCDAVHIVSNMRQLAAAVDSLFLAG